MHKTLLGSKFPLDYFTVEEEEDEEEEKEEEEE